MILEKDKNASSTTVGMEDTVSMTIDASDTNILMKILSEGLYTDPIGSTIREWVSNSLDSHTEAGVTEPVIVEIVQDKNYVWWFKTTDYGVGISPERQEKVISKYAASTKRQSSTMIGAFGLGLKSGLSYSDSFLYTTRYNGTEYQYIMYKGEDSTKIDKIYEKPTAERNGTTFQIQIKDWKDRYTFVDKCKEQLCYFENVFFKVNEINNDFKILKNADWKFSELNRDHLMHLSLDNVYYSLDFSKLGVKPISIPIALNFAVSEGLVPTPSRESITLTPFIKQLIKEKIKKVCEYFITKYNESVLESNSFLDIVKKFDKPKYTITDGVMIELEPLEEFSDVKIAKPSLKGIVKLDLETLAKNHTHMFDNYYVSGMIVNNRFRGNYEDDPNKIIGHISSDSYLRTQERPKGVLMDYIRETCNGKKFLYKRHEKRLGHLYKNYHNESSYITLLGLKKHPKEDWRDIIKEYQEIEKSIIDKVPLVADIKPTEEWLAIRKANRRRGSKLFITKEEVNPKWAMTAERGDNYATFKSTKPVKIGSLGKEKILSVYGTLENKDTLDNLYSISGRSGRVRPVLFSERDSLKMQKANLHNWITISKFMEGKTKPFKAFATAIRAERLRQKHSAAFNNSDYVEELSTEVKELISKINKYVNKYRSSYMSHDLTEAVLLVAEQNNLWDEELRSDLDKAEKLFKGPLDFLGLVHVPVKNSGGEKYDKKAINALRDLLKYRKFKMDAAFYNTKPHDKLEDILSSEDTDQEEGLDDEEGELVNVTIVEEDEDDVAVDVDEEELETV